MLVEDLFFDISEEVFSLDLSCSVVDNFERIVYCLFSIGIFIERIDVR